MPNISEKLSINAHNCPNMDCQMMLGVDGIVTLGQFGPWGIEGSRNSTESLFEQGPDEPNGH